MSFKKSDIFLFLFDFFCLFFVLCPLILLESTMKRLFESLHKSEDIKANNSFYYYLLLINATISLTYLVLRLFGIKRILTIQIVKIYKYYDGIYLKNKKIKIKIDVVRILHFIGLIRLLYNLVKRFFFELYFV